MKVQSVLQWAPRLLGAIYAVFMSTFAFNAWGTGAGFSEELAAFLVYLMPAYFVLAALTVAWKYPWVGGILFIVLATAFGLYYGWQETTMLLLVALPPTAIGLLFMCDSCATWPRLQPRM